MFPKPVYASTRAVMLVGALLGPADKACAQVPAGADNNIVETVPNLIKKIGPYGTELVIEGDVINERTPCKPKYPESSIRNGETGAVTLQLMVNSKGYVSRAKVIETSGFRDLDRASMIGFLGCKFKPTEKDGIPADTWIGMRYVWKIE